MDKIKSFTDLIAWQKGHLLVVEIYKTLERFPNIEKFALSDQMRRSSVSITSNIAEGFSRNSQKEKIQFFYLSLGSLTELQNQLLVSRDVGYLEKTKFKEIAEQSVEVDKIIRGLIKSLTNKEAKY